MEFRAGSISVMAAGVTMNDWPVGAVSSNGLKNLRWWRDPQAGRERQHERRDDAKSEYGEQNRQREAQMFVEPRVMRQTSQAATRPAPEATIRLPFPTSSSVWQCGHSGRLKTP